MSKVRRGCHFAGKKKPRHGGSQGFCGSEGGGNQNGGGKPRRRKTIAGLISSEKSDRSIL